MDMIWKGTHLSITANGPFPLHGLVRYSSLLEKKTESK